MKIIPYHFSTLPSTNSFAKDHPDLIEAGELGVISCDQQTEGRGRASRKWISEPSQNLTISLCFYLKKGQQNCYHLAQLLSLSCSKLLLKHYLAPSIKWPNDILIKGKKIAGVLSEIQDKGPYLFAVNGIGLNVNSHEFDGLKATSLSIETTKTYSLSKIQSELTQIFHDDLTLFLKEGFLPFLTEYRSLLIHKNGDLIQFHIKDELFQGVFHSLTPEGWLNVSDKDGKIKTLYSGEILPP